MKYRVDNIPLWIRPVYLTLSFFMAVSMYGLALFFRATCRLEFVDKEKYFDPSKNYIICIWHENFIPYFITFVRHPKKHAWLNHVDWTIKPIDFFLGILGIEEVVRGSTGHAGKEAADQLVGFLQKGYSTTIGMDGPSGPPKIAKKGALHIALQAGVPLLALKFKMSKKFVFKKTWDGKKIPYPFSKITVHYSKPIRITSENFEQAYQELTKALG